MNTTNELQVQQGSVDDESSDVEEDILETDGNTDAIDKKNAFDNKAKTFYVCNSSNNVVLFPMTIGTASHFPSLWCESAPSKDLPDKKIKLLRTYYHAEVTCQGLAYGFELRKSASYTIPKSMEWLKKHHIPDTETKDLTWLK